MRNIYASFVLGEEWEKNESERKEGGRVFS